jgi:predicted kinase
LRVLLGAIYISSDVVRKMLKVNASKLESTLYPAMIT